MKTSLIGADAGEFTTKDETIIDFMNRVELTRGHDDIIEASEAIIKHFQPRGLGDAIHFDYKGVHVCPIGKREELEKKLSLTREQIAHPNG